jgi:UPF0716 protein FxsA
MPFSLIPFLLLAIPIAEIGAFILIGGQIGVLWTFVMILLTAIIGSILLRIQGFQIINRLREVTNAGEIPGKELGHGAMILIAGVLLLTPGFITDGLGFLLFVPFVRSFIWKFLASKIQILTPGDFGTREGGPFSRHRNNSEDVVDLDPADFKDTSPQKDDKHSPWNKGLSDGKDT